MERPHGEHCGCCAAPKGGAEQSLGEMDFERGLAGAALRGDVSRLRHLLGRPGAHPDETSQGGYTPLMYAARNGHVEACRALLEAGADPNLATSGGKATALHRAALMGHADVVRLLLQRGANGALHDADGLTALQRAEKSQQVNVAAILRHLCTAE